MKIHLSFVEYKVVKISYPDNKQDEIMNSLELKYFAYENNQTNEFLNKLVATKKVVKDFDFVRELEFNLISDSAFIEYELPAFFATNAHITSFAHEINSAYRYSESLDYWLTWYELSDVDENIIQLFPESLENLEKFIYFDRH